jgi:hypothetical protein
VIEKSEQPFRVKRFSQHDVLIHSEAKLIPLLAVHAGVRARGSQPDARSNDCGSRSHGRNRILSKWEECPQDLLQVSGRWRHEVSSICLQAPEMFYGD